MADTSPREAKMGTSGSSGPWPSYRMRRVRSLALSMTTNRSLSSSVRLNASVRAVLSAVRMAKSP